MMENFMIFLKRIVSNCSLKMKKEFQAKLLKSLVNVNQKMMKKLKIIQKNLKIILKK
jgi:hypothetical protein